MPITKIIYMDHHVNAHQEFFCDYCADIDYLPTNVAAGSMAFVWEDLSFWIINSEGEWKEFRIEDGAAEG